MNILVTGASGFIGRNLIKELIKNSENSVYAMSRKGNLIEGTTTIKCDVLDAENVESVFIENQFDTVIHLAAITSHDEIVGNKTKTLEINMKGTTNLLNSFNTHCKGAQFVYSSSGKVYGRTNEIPISENAYTNPTNILGKSKLLTEKLIEFYAKSNNKYLICRIFNIYGENQRSNFLLPTIIEQLSNDTVILGALRDFRDNLYISDLIDALKLCIENPQKFKNYDVVNIGSGRPTCVEDFIKEIGQIIGRNLVVRVDKSKLRKDETPVEYCTYEKIEDLVGWEPGHSLADGLRKSLIAQNII